MLGLMCTIYRGEGTIPRNRPDVYSKCAEMLFERWDKRRGIHVYLPFEAHVRPAMNHLACWIYSDESLQAGVSESALVEETTKYLLKWCFDDPVEAQSAARQFVEFCSGRAWVFTDTGTKRGGEKLFQFTHRTFLEYFTAVQLIQTHRTPEELGSILHPHIAKREWDIVAQLTFQLKGKGFEGDADILLRGLLAAAVVSTSPAAWNFVHFAARCLEFMVPTPPVRREIATECFKRSIDWGLQGCPLLWPQSDVGKPSAYALAHILRVAPENRASVAECLKILSIKSINCADPSEALLGAEIGSNLGFAVHARTEVPLPNELPSFWDSISKDISVQCETRIAELAKRDRNLA
jgi:hypothetical protein